MQTETMVPTAISHLSKRRVCRWTVLAALAIAGACAVFLNKPQRQFLRATEGADQLEFIPTYPDDAPALLVVRGQTAVAEFVDLIEIEGWFGVQPCKCIGEVELRFHRAGRAVATLGLAHGERLKWRDGVCGQDRRLTKASRAALQAWLIAHDIPMGEGDGGGQP